MRFTLPHCFRLSPHNVRRYFTILSLLGVFVLLIILRSNSIHTPFERDEGEYAYSARLLLRGDVPFTESFLQKPPPIIFTYAIGQLFDPNGVAAPRVLAMLFLLGTIYLVGYIGYKEFGLLVGIASMWIVVPMVSFPYLTALAANTEVFMLLPLTATVALYVKMKSQESTPYYQHILVGFLSTIAILYKPIAVFPLIFLFGVWVVNIWKRHHNRNKLLFVLSFWCIGCVISSTVFLGYFLLRGAGPYMWDSIVDFNSHYVTFFGLGFTYLLRRFSQFATTWTPLIFLLVWALVRESKKLWLYFGLFITSLLGIFQTPIGHYYLMLMPFWALITAYAIYSLASYIDNQAKLFFTFLFTAIVVVYMLLGVREQFTMTSAEIGQWVYGRTSPFAESLVVGKKLNELTNPTDSVFVAGSEPQILYYADRKSSSRFVITYPFIIKTPKQLIYQKEAARELTDHPPSAIVLSQKSESGLWDEASPSYFRDFLNNLLKTKYNLIGGSVWEGESFTWRTQISEDELFRTSLLLFQKK
ncbi:hypothetical protein KBB12_01805 [Candidatus Woesebacteria bacterium]|nr:hypothetical protein [Candidatus Woesebacteria bacterium]